MPEDVVGKFHEDCSQQQQHLDRLCWPDTKAIVTAMKANSAESFAHQMIGVVDSLVPLYIRHPNTLESLGELLEPSLPWTKPWCNDFSKKLELMHRTSQMVRHTSEEMAKIYPESAKAYQRWFERMRGSKSKRLQKLLKKHEEAEKKAAETKVINGAPLEKIIQHLQAKAVERVLRVSCHGTNLLGNLLQYGDNLGRNVLHYCASSGFEELAHVFLKLESEHGGNQLASRVDREGNTAIDWAYNGRHAAFVKVVKDFGGYKGSKQAVVKRFPKAKKIETDDDGVCASDPRGGKGSCLAKTGGWNVREIDNDTLPSSWLPPADKQCAVDVIDVSQFDVFTFTHLYFIRGRPLMVKGGARFAKNIAELYTRDGLAKAFGAHEISVTDLPYGEGLGAARQVKMSMSAYLDSLEKRTKPQEELHYYFASIPHGDVLNFTTVQPDLIHAVNRYVELAQYQTQFYIGGTLMGSPYHFHGTAGNSLLHGKKLWLLKPPAQRIWSNDIIYKSLMREGPGDSMKCVQDAGDFLFVPNGWSHGVMCLSDCIGVAHEWGSPAPLRFL